MALTTLEFALLKELTELDGIASFEDEIRDYLKKRFKEMKVDYVCDGLGSIAIGYDPLHKNNKSTIMIDCHMDEVGFIVSKLCDDGTIGITPVGGINIEDCLDTSYRLKTSEGKTFVGTIVDRNVDCFEDLRLEFGFLNKKELLENGVNYFDMVTFITEFKEIGDDLYQCKAIDNRYSIALCLDLMEHFKNKELPFNLAYCFSAQEEVGLRGAQCMANMIKPNIAIVLDCSRAVKDPDGFGHIGDGVLLRFFDPSMVAFKELITLQKEACEKSGAKYQYFMTRGGTDAGVIHKAYHGIRTLTHCICAVDIHTPKSIFRGSDYQNAKKSLIYLLENLTEEKLEDIYRFRD